MGLAFDGIEEEIQDLPDAKITPAPKAESYTVTKETASKEESKFIDKKLVDPVLEKSEANKIVSRIDDTLDNTMNFEQAISLVNNHGSKAIRDSAKVANGILERSSTSYASTKKSGNKDTKDVAGQLLALRELADDIAPTEKEMGLKKFFGLVPGKAKLDKFVQRRENASEQLKAIDEGLVRGQHELQRDNAELFTSRKNMISSMQEIDKERRILDEAKDVIREKIDSYEREGEVDKANTLKAEVLSAVEKRRMDLSTQFAVSMQAVMTVKIIEDSNTELVKGIETARNVTMVALQNAVVVAHALENQRQNIEAVKNVRETTNNLMQKNAEQLSSQVDAIKEINSSSGVSLETLKKSFDAIRDTSEQIQRFKIESADNMNAVTRELDNQIQSASATMQSALTYGKGENETLSIGNGGEM